MNRLFSQLQKALTTSGDGEALVPTDFDQSLYEELLKMQPLAMALDVIQAEGKTHEYKVKTSHPLAWFEGETGKGSNQNGAYQRKTVMLKIQRIWGSVTGFAQAVDEAFIDALEEEVSGALEGFSNLIEFSVMWGASNDIGFSGDAYQYSGIIPRIFAYAPTNVVDAGGDKITLPDLDEALDIATAYRQVKNDPKMWIMSQRMKTVVDGLQTKVQIPLTQAELADGKIVMDAYGRTPIFESDYLAPAAVTTSPTPGGAIAAGGTLPDGTYTYKLASITMYGEQVASAASGNFVAGSGNNKANLTWTADANAKSYMVFRKLSTDSVYSLIDIIAAKTYDADGIVNGTVAAYTDDGSKSLIAVKPLAAGEQNILLLNMSPRRGASFVGKVDDMGRRVDNLLSFIELARTKDSYDFFLKSYHALRVVYPNLFTLVRHCKLS